jgi:hypothetical protein
MFGFGGWIIAALFPPPPTLFHPSLHPLSSLRLHPSLSRPRQTTAGNVVFAEIMLLPNGMSKGCGCVSLRLSLSFGLTDSPSFAVSSNSPSLKRLNALCASSTTSNSSAVLSSFARCVSAFSSSFLSSPLTLRPFPSSPHPPLPLPNPLSRQDREEDARYGAAAIAGRAGYMGPGAFAGRGGFGGPGFGGRGGFGGGFAAGGGHQVAGQGRHLFIQGVRLPHSALPLFDSNSKNSTRTNFLSSLSSFPPTQLPYTVGWQDLKDLFRAAGSIIRADVKMGPDGSHSGTGTVVYETAQDAQNAISAFPLPFQSPLR